MSKKRKRYNHYAKNIKKKRKRADSKLTLIQRMLRLTAKILYAIIVLFIISIVKYVILSDYWSELPVEVAVIPFLFCISICLMTYGQKKIGRIVEEKWRK